jgi:glycerophosphoryl diester phosphodiesterase
MRKFSFCSKALVGPYGLLQLVFIYVLSTCLGCSSGEAEKIMLVKQKRKIALIAHRGAADSAPENTLAAIRKALEGPAEFIEIDIHQTRDQQVVVMHDATVNRTTNGQGPIGNLTLAELRQLDAGSWYDATFSQEKVPTLEEVLTLVKGKKKLLIEIKKGDDYYEGIENNTLELIRKHQAQRWTVIQSFYDEVLTKVWKSEYAVPTHKLIVGKIPWLPIYFDHRLRWGSLDKYYQATAINVNQYFATRAFIRHVHSKGFKTYVWTVDEPQDINKVTDRGADGVISNTVAHLEIEKI